MKAPIDEKALKEQFARIGIKVTTGPEDAAAIQAKADEGRKDEKQDKTEAEFYGKRSRFEKGSEKAKQHMRQLRKLRGKKEQSDEEAPETTD